MSEASNPLYPSLRLPFSRAGLNRANASKRKFSESFTLVIQPLSTIKFLFNYQFFISLSRQRSTTVSLETTKPFNYACPTNQGPRTGLLRTKWFCQLESLEFTLSSQWSEVKREREGD